MSEMVYLEKWSVTSAQFGGINGTIVRLTVDRKFWNDLGKPEVLSIYLGTVDD